MQENAVYRYLARFGQANLLAPSAILFAIGPNRTCISGESRFTPGVQLDWVVLNTVARDSCAFFDCFSHRSPERDRIPRNKELASYLASSRLAFNFLTYQRDVRDADAASGAAEASESALQSLLV